MASELVTNAMLHSRTRIRLTLRADGLDALWIEVYDENSRLPVASVPPADATSGRGLGIVASLASTWGTRSLDEGKTVWAQLGHAGTDEADCIDLTTSAAPLGAEL